MSELFFWKPAITSLLESIRALGHDMGEFDPVAPHILPSNEDFSSESYCRNCRAFLHVQWSPCDGEGLTAHGSALEDQCKKFCGN